MRDAASTGLGSGLAPGFLLLLAIMPLLGGTRYGKDMLTDGSAGHIVAGRDDTLASVAH
jgi:hypothetical protein